MKQMVKMFSPAEHVQASLPAFCLLGSSRKKLLLSPPQVWIHEDKFGEHYNASDIAEDFAESTADAMAENLYYGIP